MSLAFYLLVQCPAIIYCWDDLGAFRKPWASHFSEASYCHSMISLHGIGYSRCTRKQFCAGRSPVYPVILCLPYPWAIENMEINVSGYLIQMILGRNVCSIQLSASSKDLESAVDLKSNVILRSLMAVTF